MEAQTMACEVEDVLGEAGVFYNGFRGPTHRACMDSYMTCINEAVLNQKWNEIESNYTREDWLGLAEHWKSFAYLSPNCSMMAFFVKRKLDEIPLDITPST